MAIDSTAPAADPQSVYEDLASGLRALLAGDRAAAAARALFRHTGDGRELVGVVGGGERAVFYDRDARALVAVPFDRHGVEADAAERLWGPVGDPATWVDANAGTVDWVHPRHRWVLADDRGSWVVP